MSGREITMAAAMVIVAIGAVEDATHHGAASPAPRPAPRPTVIVRTVTQHTMTRAASGSPLSGWEIMLIAIAALIISGWVACVLNRPRP